MTPARRRALTGLAAGAAAVTLAVTGPATAGAATPPPAPIVNAIRAATAQTPFLASLPPLFRGQVNTGPSSFFGRMFGGLPALTGQSPQQIADLAGSMLDPNVTDPAAGSKDNHFLPSGDTYFGQFIDHDLTRDQTDSPTAPTDPTLIPDGESFRLDLSSVFCGGPTAFPSIYAADHLHLLVQESNVNGVRDLPRNPDGSAILCEPRNDENEIISQIHTGFLEFYNHIVDRFHLPYGLASRLVIWNYQWIVLHEFLPAIAGQDVVNGYLPGCASSPLGCLHRFYDPGQGAPMVPIEWSVAAYRFGHSMVRKAYQVNDTTGKLQVFNSTDADLHGGLPLPAGRQIDFGNFFDQLAAGGDTPGSPFTGGVENGPASAADPQFNFSRNIDDLLSSGLFDLPIPGAEANGPNVLGFRNMIRAAFYAMPSGQTVAAAMGLDPIPVSAFPAAAALDNGAFAAGLPLWYYILGEADQDNGGHVLGPVGARIVADVIVRVLQADPGSILNGVGRVFRPLPPVALHAGQLTMADLLTFAGVATRPTTSPPAPPVFTSPAPAAAPSDTGTASPADTGTPAPAGTDTGTPAPSDTGSPSPSAADTGSPSAADTGTPAPADTSTGTSPSPSPSGS